MTLTEMKIALDVCAHKSNALLKERDKIPTEAIYKQDEELCDKHKKLTESIECWDSRGKKIAEAMIDLVAKEF